jgi:hypothetical protein
VGAPPTFEKPHDTTDYPEAGPHHPVKSLSFWRWSASCSTGTSLGKPFRTFLEAHRNLEFQLRTLALRIVPSQGEVSFRTCGVCLVRASPRLESFELVFLPRTEGRSPALLDNPVNGSSLSRLIRKHTDPRSQRLSLPPSSFILNYFSNLATNQLCTGNFRTTSAWKLPN